MMKKTILILGIILFTLTGCSIEGDSNNQPSQITITEWNLINVTGGIAGVDHDFETGDIVWSFNNINALLTVNNNNTEDDLEDGLSTGSYNISFIETNDDLFLRISDQEFGEVIISGTDNEDMVIDQNSLSTGQGSDGFVYTFKRTTRVIEV